MAKSGKRFVREQNNRRLRRILKNPNIDITQIGKAVVHHTNYGGGVHRSDIGSGYEHRYMEAA